MVVIRVLQKGKQGVDFFLFWLVAVCTLWILKHSYF